MKLKITAILFLFLCLIGSTLAYTEGVKKCDVYTDCIFGEYIYNDSWYPLTAQICTITFNFENGTSLISGSAMTNNSDGWHNYTVNFTESGFYRGYIFCNDSGDLAYKDTRIYVEQTTRSVVGNILYNQSIIAGLINDIPNTSEVWSYTSRNLTYIDWGTGSQFVWNATDRNLTFSNGSTITAKEIWEYASRNLTYGDWVRYDNISNLYTNNSVIAGLINGLNDINATDVWVYYNRNLTTYNQTDMWVYLTGINNTQANASDIWGYSNRVLSNYSGVWEYTTRTLTDYNQSELILYLGAINLTVTQIRLNQTVLANLMNQAIQNTTVIANLVNGLTDLNASDVWTYTNRNLTYIDWGTGSQFVWNATSRNLTYYNTTAGSLTAQQVWEYASRNLTYGDWVRYDNISGLYANASVIADLINNLNNINASDVWGYSTRTFTNQTDMFVYLASINSTVLSINSSLNATNIAQTVWAFQNRSISTPIWGLQLSDTASVGTNKNYNIRLRVTNISDMEINLTSTPLITLTNPFMSDIIVQASMTYISTGIYEYQANLSGANVSGNWRSQVYANTGGKNQTLTSYFVLSSSPPLTYTKVIGVDNGTGVVTANITIKNEGSNDQEYIIRWWITDAVYGQYNDSTVVDSYSYSQVLHPGDVLSFLDSNLSIIDYGTYWYKVEVYWGDMRSGASDQFTWVSPIPPSPGGGGSGGAGQPPSMTGIFNMSLQMLSNVTMAGSKVTVRLWTISKLGLVTDGVLTYYIEDPKGNKYGEASMDYMPEVDGYIDQSLNLPTKAVPGKWKYVVIFDSKQKGIHLMVSTPFEVEGVQNNWLLWVLVGVGALLGMAVLFFVIRSRTSNTQEVLLDDYW